ncbi:hypothetical protein [Streptomyces sp. NPDC048248]|uniref:hypothetical protein n=1 Tax=Streptomyces sp. NPDC048248 TaxID=3365523 RepID=UPI0037248760
MGWVHDEPDDDLYDHEGYPVAVLADGSEPEPVQQTFSLPGGGTGSSPNSAWWLYNGQDDRPLAVAVRAACACGWRSADTFPVDFADHEGTDGWEADTGPFAAWRYEHIDALRGVAMPRALHEALRNVEQLLQELSAERPMAVLAAVGRLEKLVGDVAPSAGAAARLDSQTWKAIGRALGTTRQAAYQRFARFLDPELVSNSKD